MRKSLVCICHPMRILPPLYCSAAIIGSIEELPRKPFFHCILGPPARTRNEPTDGQRLAAIRPYFDWHLIGGAADAARAYFHRGTNIAERVVEHAQRILATAPGDAVKRAVDDPLGYRFLAFIHQAIHKLG